MKGTDELLPSVCGTFGDPALLGASVTPPWKKPRPMPAPHLLVPAGPPPPVGTLPPLPAGPPPLPPAVGPPFLLFKLTILYQFGLITLPITLPPQTLPGVFLSTLGARPTLLLIKLQAFPALSRSPFANTDTACTLLLCSKRALPRFHLPLNFPETLCSPMSSPKTWSRTLPFGSSFGVVWFPIHPLKTWTFLWGCTL
jgi:hypothetical protein